MTTPTHMTRPVAIRRFGWLWLGSTLCWGVATALTWASIGHALATRPQTAAVAGFAQPMWVSIVLLVTIALWYAAAVRASRVARSLVVVVAAASGLRGLAAAAALVGAGGGSLLPPVMTIVSAGLAVAAAAMLFRDDARDWFGDVGADPDDNEEHAW